MGGKKRKIGESPSTDEFLKWILTRAGSAKCKENTRRRNDERRHLHVLKVSSDSPGDLGSLNIALGEDSSGALRDGRVLTAVGALASLLGRWGRLLALVPCRAAVHTGPLAFGTVALLKLARVVVGRLVPVAAHNVVNVRAPLCVVRARDAGTEAELVGRDKVLPLAKTLEAASELAGENEGTTGVAVAGSTVGVELSTLVASLDVDLGQVTGTSDLKVRRSLEEVGTLDGTVGDEPGTVAALQAPRDDSLLLVTNRARASLAGAVQAEVWKQGGGTKSAQAHSD